MVGIKIAIDGPAASGKSSAAELLGKMLNMPTLDSGLLYRAVTFILLNFLNNPEILTENQVNENKELIETIELRFKNKDLYSIKGEEETLLAMKNLRSSLVDVNVKTVAKILFVRKRVKVLQENFANNEDLIMIGRDIGTVILPNASIKFFITCSAKTRAERRLKQDPTQNYEKLLKDIEARDREDTEREHSPLLKAKDAILINNDDMTLEETAKYMYDFVQQMMHK